MRVAFHQQPVEVGAGIALVAIGDDAARPRRAGSTSVHLRASGKAGTTAALQP